MSNTEGSQSFRNPPQRWLIASGLALASVVAACAPDFSPSQKAPPRQAATRNVPTAEARMCRARLAEAGADFVPLPDLAAGQCSSSNAIELLHLVSDSSRIAVTNLDRVSCPLSQTFAAWVRFAAGRAAEQILGSRLVRVETFGSYSCRNVAGSSRLSAHASADAIDVSAFVLADGRRVTLERGWNGSEAERRFLRIVHASACKRFGTVLGPDYNAAHRDHFHLETGGGGYCR